MDCPNIDNYCPHSPSLQSGFNTSEDEMFRSPWECSAAVENFGRLNRYIDVFKQTLLNHTGLLDNLPNQSIDTGELKTSLNLFEQCFVDFENTVRSLRNEYDNQVAHCNQLEAVLTDYDSRSISHAHELTDAETHLTSSVQLISNLQQQVATNHRRFIQRFHALNDDPSSQISTPDQLPAIPSVLNLVTTLDSVYAELQRSEELRLAAECRATSALEMVEDFKRCQPLNEEAVRDDGPYRPLEDMKMCSVGSQTCSHDDKSSNANFGVGFYAFSLPKDVVLHHPGKSKSFSGDPQVAQLSEALRNALTQIKRLDKCRLGQRSKIEQLQLRLSQLDSELDATVDALRYHQKCAEEERRRSASELVGLQRQLARAKAQLGHSYQGSSGGLVSQPVRASSVSPGPLRSSSNSAEAHLNDTLVELAMTRTELDHLREEMTQQKASTDREATKLRGQLAESTADARALRLQVNRLQSVLGKSANTDFVSIRIDSPCVNCRKLQSLLDLLQTKSSNSALQKAFCSFSDACVQCEGLDEHKRMVSSNEASSERSDFEVQQLKQLLHHKGVELSNIRSFLQSTTDNNTSPSVKVSLPTLTRQVGEPIVESLPTLCEKSECAVQTNLLDRAPNDDATVVPFDLLGETSDRLSHCPDLLPPDSANRTLSLHNLYEELVSVKDQLEMERRRLEMEKCEFHRLKSNHLLAHPLPMENVAHSFSVSPSDPTECSILSHGQLSANLKSAELEAADAVAQLKASNVEFLTLRERLSHAAVERAHLKLTIEGLDEQVSQLESVLYERTLQLNHYRDQLTRTTQKLLSPESLMWLSAPTKSRLSVKCQEWYRKCGLANLAPRLEWFKCNGRFHTDDTLLLPLVQTSRRAMTVEYRPRRCVQIMIQRIGQFKLTVRELLLGGHLLHSCRGHLARIRSRLRLQSQPRPSVIFVLICYFLLLHMLILRFWFTC